MRLLSVQTDTALLLDWLPVPPPTETTVKCLVHIIASNWQIVGSDQTEMVSLCLINTQLMMLNYQCLIMEEQSCQSGDKQEPSGSLITICWWLAFLGTRAVGGPPTVAGVCLALRSASANKQSSNKHVNVEKKQQQLVHKKGTRSGARGSTLTST